MKIVLIVFCIIGWLLISFGTYFLGLCLGVFGITKWVRVVDIYKTEEVSQPNIIKFIQFIFWPVALPYLIVFMLIKLAEVCLENLQHKEERKRECERAPQVIRRIKEWKESEEVNHE